jgi:hypothetical protein
MLRVASAFLLAICLHVMSAMADGFPPIADRYDTISDDARAIVKGLKKLQAKTEIGVNFVDYNQAVSEVYPDLTLFLESAEARNQPELRFVLANSMDCYLTVRELWSKKVSSDDPLDQYSATVKLITAQPTLWKVAGANTSGAAALLDSPKADLQQVQDMISTNADSLTLEAALAAADEEGARLQRESRAKETGVAVPAEVTEEDRQDLAALAIQEGDLLAGTVSNGVQPRLPAFYEKVPPARQEGMVMLSRDGEPAGDVTILLYDDITVAKKAYEALQRNMGGDRRRVSDLGNIAEAAGSTPSVRHVSVIFRRHTAVVDATIHGQFPIDAALDGLRKTDLRLAKTAGEGGPSDSSSTERSLAEVLFQDGDLGEAVVGTTVADGVPPMLQSMLPSADRASVELKSGGAPCGFVAGFAYESIAAASKAYRQVATSFGRGAGKVSRIGNEAVYVVHRAGTGSLVFRRGDTVVCVRCPATEVDELAAFARKIDARFVESDDGRGETSNGDAINVRELCETADEVIAEGGDKARFMRSIVGIAGTKTWQRKGEDSTFEGTLVSVSPDGVVFETPDGEITIRVQDLSGDSGSKIVRLKEISRKLAALGE